MKTKPLRLLRQKRASWLKSVFVLTCLLLSTSVAMAQTKTVTGTVTDSFNEPLIGASILVKGTSTGAGYRYGWQILHFGNAQRCTRILVCRI